jgi:hypothetical protein
MRFFHPSLAAALMLPTALLAQAPQVTKDAPPAALTFNPAPGAARGAFVIRMGSDTLGVERFARTRDRLVGESVGRAPRTVHRNYEVTYGPDGAVTSFAFHSARADQGAPPTTANATFAAETATVNMSVNGQPRTMSVAARGALPQMGVTSSVALLEAATRRLVVSGRDSLTLPMLFGGAPTTTPMTLRRVGRDSVTISFPQQPPFRARIDATGSILGLQGLETTQKVVVERVRDADVPALVAQFAQRDAAGQSFGTLSPADTARATLGAGSVKVGYSQPALRGRTAVGGLLVPYGQVWRTGANQATTLTTDVDLDVGGTLVPKGTYTLWTLPTESGWTLIVNRKILDERGQPLWGTMYDQSQDLARIPMQVSSSADKTERFTITLEPSGAGSTLKMAWENTVATVPITPKS